MAAGGYDIGASLAMSSSSGANQSSAFEGRGGGNFGGTSYGPGALVITDQSDSIGASGSGGGINWLTIAAAGAVVIVGLLLLRK